IGWQPPTGSFVKLNTDGARKDNGKAGCGGVIRGSQGEWLGGFAKGVGTCSAFVAELWGVFEGLTYARRMRFMHIELNIDSAMVVQVLKTGNLNSPFGLTLVKNIRRLVDMEWEVHITHAYRESNRCADALTNIGCTLDKETIYFEDC
ncbi:ribonuclease H, partial [Trifolium pratense]